MIKDLGTKQARAATGRAISRTAVTLSKETVKAIRSERLVKMSASDLKRKLTTRVKVKGDIRSMYASIAMSTAAISLARFYARRAPPPKGLNRISKIGNKDQRLKAVKVTVLGRTQYAGKGRAFLTDVNGGMIFMRTGRKRLPIKKLWGPSVSDLARASGIVPKLQAIGVKRFSDTLEQEIQFRTSRIGKVKP